MATGLLVFGTGIQAAGQFTVEARGAVEQCDVIHYLVADDVTRFYLESLNQNLVSLHDCYATDKPRMQSYIEMVERVTGDVETGKLVGMALYGHPGVFAYPAHEAIRRVRASGHYARMIPGVSAEDCLFADLGVDPAWAGCQSFEATDFLLFGREFDPRSSLILWQVGVIGDTSFQAKGYNYRKGIEILADRLISKYGRDHKVIVYEASHYPIYPPRRDVVLLSELATTRLTPESTLYVPPNGAAKPDPNMLELLGITDVEVARIKLRVGQSTLLTA